MTQTTTEISTQTATADIDSLNQNLLQIDLDDLQVEAMDERLELALTVLFDADAVGGEPAEANGGRGPYDPGSCGQFSCNSYFPG